MRWPWQTTLPGRLSKLLPRVQVIATTHSPLVALGAAPDELVVLERKGRNVVAHECVRDFQGYSVEDMLADRRLFDSSIYAPKVARKLTRYRELAGKPRAERSEKEVQDLQTLGAELVAQQIPEFRENPALKRLQAILKRHNL